MEAFTKKVYSPAYKEEISVKTVYDYYYFKTFNGNNYSLAVAYATTMEQKTKDQKE